MTRETAETDRRAFSRVCIFLDSTKQETQEDWAIRTMKNDKKQIDQSSRDRSGHDLLLPDQTVHQQGPAEKSQDRHDPCVPIYDFEVISEGQRMVIIRLGGENYTLRRTQGGKLLLNK